MYSHFRDNINLPNSYPFVLGHCYPFLVKNRVFGLLDRIVLKLPQKIRKNSRTITPLKENSYGTPPLKIQNPKKFALVYLIFRIFLWYFYIFMILFDRFLAFFT